MLYPLLFIIILAFTPYWSDHSTELLVLGSVLLLGAVVRTTQVMRMEQWYSKNPDNWRIIFFIITSLFGLSWGMFCMLTVTHYQLQWTAMLVLLSTAGVATVAVVTLSIYYYLVVSFLTFLLVPSILAMALMATEESLAVMLMFFIFVVILLIVGRRLYNEYWQALENTFLLDQRAQQLEDSNRELESYSYSIAHDLRAPLRAMTAFSQLLHEDARERLDDTEKDYLKRIVSAGHHMAELIDDILELSRITRIDIQHSTVNISELAEECLQGLQASDPERQVDTRVQPGIYVLGDPRLLRIVLQNLLSNAWKFTGRCKLPKIEVGRYISDQSQVIFVKDNGAGFDMKYADKIFGIFQRLHTREEFEGTGIGLASVQRVISRHRGKIWMDAQLNEGATFYFSLP